MVLNFVVFLFYERSGCSLFADIISKYFKKRQETLPASLKHTMSLVIKSHYVYGSIVTAYHKESWGSTTIKRNFLVINAKQINIGSAVSY